MDMGSQKTNILRAPRQVLVRRVEAAFREAVCNLNHTYIDNYVILKSMKNFPAKSSAPGRGRPLKSDRRRARATFTIHPSSLEWISARARAEKLSSSEYLNRLIERARIAPTGDTPDSFVRLTASVRKEQIEAFCVRNGVRYLAVFGSYATGKAGPESDVDILIDWEKERVPGLMGMMRMQEELEEIFSHKVDLRTPQELSGYFRDEVLRQARVIYEP